MPASIIKRPIPERRGFDRAAPTTANAAATAKKIGIQGAPGERKDPGARVAGGMRRRSGITATTVRPKKIQSAKTTESTSPPYVPVRTRTIDQNAWSRIARCGVAKRGWSWPRLRKKTPSCAIA